MESDIEVQLFGDGTDDVCGDEDIESLRKYDVDTCSNETRRNELLLSFDMARMVQVTGRK